MEGTMYVRVKGDRDLALAARAFGPKPADHPSVGQECPACGDFLKPGDHTTLVALGPGGDPDEREKATAGGFYNAVAVECHYACVTGADAEA